MSESNQTLTQSTEEIKYRYKKTCPFCKKPYGTNSRNQKFCTPEHGKFYAVRKEKSKIFRDENKTLLRFKARAHALAVELLRARFDQLGLIPQCSKCEKKEGVGDGLVKLEVHHCNQNFLDNRIENLVFLCVDCHHKEHRVKLTRDELVTLAGEDFVLMFEAIYSFKEAA